MTRKKLMTREMMHKTFLKALGRLCVVPWDRVDMVDVLKMQSEVHSEG